MKEMNIEKLGIAKDTLGIVGNMALMVFVIVVYIGFVRITETIVKLEKQVQELQHPKADVLQDYNVDLNTMANEPIVRE